MILRRLRGIMGTALLWGAPWAFILGTVAAAAALVLRANLGPLRAFTQGALTGLSWGLAAGALFGSALMLAEQRRGFAGLTRARGALWGTLAGIWFPALIGLAVGPNSLPLMVGGWPAYLATGAMGALSGLVTVWFPGNGVASFEVPSSTGMDPFSAISSSASRSSPTDSGALSKLAPKPTRAE
jgi:hypothetical protein